MTMGILRSGPTDHAPGRAKRSRLRKPVAALAAAGILVAGLISGQAAAQPTVETRLADATNPAVQIITTEYNAKVKLRAMTWSRDGSSLIDYAAAKVVAGQLSRGGFIGYIFDRAQRDPTRYFEEFGKARTAKLRAQYVGSGFVATPDGYVLTARHVVTPDAAVKAYFAETGARSFAEADTAALLSAFSDEDLSSGAMNDIKRAVSGFARAKVRVDLGTPKVTVRLGVASASGSRVGENKPAEVVYRSNPDLGADVAVLRIRVPGPLPVVTLGDGKPQQGSVVYLNAFPAAATYLKDFDKASQLQPTLTKGMITAPKVTEGGIELLQTDANASGGSSGGAAFDESGKVIGMLVAGAQNEQGSVGQNYLMPIDVIKDALTRSGANLVPSQTSVVYDQALNDFYAEYYSKAKGEFEQVKNLFPAHAYVGRFIADSQAAINAGKDKTPPPEEPGLQVSPLVLGGSVAGLVILGLAVVVVLLLIRRRPGPASGPERPGQWGGEPLPGTDPSSDQAQPVTAGSVDGAVGPVGIPGVAATAGVGAVALAESGPDDPLGSPEGFQPLTTSDSADDDAPDAFPGWDPIDYVPAVPPAGPGQGS